jgi:hypothetical protein
MADQPEFKVLGQTMATLTIAYGLVLIAWGGFFSIGSSSITSAIPSFIGLPIVVAGLLTRSLPAQRKIWMHVAVLFGAFAFLGGLAFFRGFMSEGGPFARPAAAASQLMLLVTGGAYTAACVRSFIWARKNRPDGSVSE